MPSSSCSSSSSTRLLLPAPAPRRVLGRLGRSPRAGEAADHPRRSRRAATFGAVLERCRPSAPSPTEEEIRRRAYQIHLRRGRDGNPVLDWLEAEAELRAERRSVRRPRHATFPGCPFPIPASS